MPALLIALCAAATLVGLGDLRVEAGRAVALMLVWGVAVTLAPRPRGGAWAVVLAALAVRAILLASPPTLSDDLYRYLWEGRVLLDGGNPYLHPPAWEGYPADAIRSAVNHPEVSTIYPPFALWGFAVVARLAYTPLAMKAAMGLLDVAVAGGLAAVLAGRRRDLGPAWLYALHPLGAVESAGSGHLEPLAVACLVAAIALWDRRSRAGAAAAVALGAAFKLFPVVLLPTVLRPGPGWGRRLAAAAAVGLGCLVALAPLVDAGPALLRGLGTYVARWSFSGSLFPVIEAGARAVGAPSWARPAAMALGAAVVAGAAWRRRDPAEVALWAGGAFVLLSPTVHPWYVCWAWIPALTVGVRAWTVLATLAPLSYVVLTTLDPATGAWEEQTWPRLVIYLPFFAALAAECAWRATRPGPWATGRAQTPSPSPSPTTPAR